MELAGERTANIMAGITPTIEKRKGALSIEPQKMLNLRIKP